METGTARLAPGSAFDKMILNRKNTGEGTRGKESDSVVNAAKNVDTTRLMGRRGKFTRSLKKAKRFLDVGFGSPSIRAGDDNTKECPQELNHTGFLSLLSRNHLNSTRGWLSIRSKPASDEKENTASEPHGLEKKDDSGPRDLKSKNVPSVLAEKELDIFNYLSPEEVEKGELFMTLGSPACGPFDKNLKTLYLVAMRESIEQNGKLINDLKSQLEDRQKSFHYGDHIAFLKHLQSLLQYETGFLQEIYYRYDLLLQENDSLREILISRKNTGILKLNER
ncbi:uncharacterized protein LALA0_S05e03246g [Lachancea lanzarotensis]|uniref:LALA0S05e03246g1_1 n=1 Tax=Lachancea lanzarotensis TaxID=1245769 RepID=A0A0C7N709_9SACH|nr:uncharacterized protein LALA0_S05e03246g [Lachancea lanzarotensis]CEP62332.1 LALA0S05e03246g1_1 [Lachancea lanzarotensis]